MEYNMFKNIKSKSLQMRALAIKTGAGATAALGSFAAMALDTTAVQTAITAAETDALTTGQYVIGTVASLVVITLVIGIVKKL
jgi:hypothetical protein